MAALKGNINDEKWTEVNITSIKKNPNNPRILKDDKFKKLVKSIKSFPEMLKIRPIVVNKDMVVLGGNMRLQACKEFGLKSIPVIKVENLTEEQEREFIIKDNVGFGEWDWDLLANEWNVDELEDWGLEGFPFETETELEAEELKDLSDTIKDLYRIEVFCKDEEEQENTYNKLIEKGYECRILTL